MSGDVADGDAAPHPRTRTTLIGHAAAERAFAQAASAGRLHHAWLIGGPDGIGKSTLAYRAARYLLASPQERTGDGGLGVDPASRTARQIAAGAHPNLIAIDLATASADVERPPAKAVPVRTARRALSFFGTTAADGGHRVCIVDPIEDLTLQAANALLKTVEEPPARATILIVSHAPQRVLPTIRSRCRKLDLRPLQDDEVLRVLDTLGPDIVGPDADAARRAAERAEGSARRALALLDPKRLALLDELSNLLELLPAPPMLRVLSLADRLADRRGEDDFDLALDAVQLWASLRLRAHSGLGAGRLAPLAELCEKLGETARSVETYNLDRRPFIVSMFGDLADAVRLG